METKISAGVRYPVGSEIQRRNGVVVLKTADFGTIPKARAIAQISSKVINGGEELKPGQIVMHMDMSSHGQPGHDRPENLVVIQRRTTKYEFLRKARVLIWGDVKPAKEISLVRTGRRPVQAGR